LITPSRSQQWQHVVKRDTGWELRLLPTPPAFNAPVRVGPIGILLYSLAQKN